MSQSTPNRIVIAAKPQPIRWPVSVELLFDGGRKATVQFDAWFIRLTASEGQKLDKQFPMLGKDASAEEHQRRDAELFSHLLASWSDNLVIEDASGQSMSHTTQPERASALHRLFESAEGGQFRLALWRAYGDWRSGQPALATKN